MDNEGVLFSVIAGYQIGTGHLLRCLNIGQHLLKKIPVFFSIEGDGSLSSLVRDKGIQVLEPEEVLEFQPRVVVVDRLEVEPQALFHFREKGAKIILLDNLSAWEMADVVINALPHSPYKNQPPKRLRIFEGPSYICLSEEFAYGHQSQRPTGGVVPKVLVTCGGSDPYGLTIKLAKALIHLPLSTNTTFILGRIFKARRELEEIILEKDFTIIQDVPSVAPFMMDSDILLTSFGLTVYEAACLGLPAIMLPPTQEHNERAEIFAAYGSAINLGLNKDVPLKRIITVIEDLLSNSKLRARMSEAGKRLVDGQGVKRVAQIILDLIGNRCT